MSENNLKISKAAQEAGYQVAHAQESSSASVISFMILVKSDRKLCYEDDLNFYRIAEQIKRDFEMVSAKTDPEGPAKRERLRAWVEGIYRSADVDAIYIEELPNGYCSQPCCFNRPWFRVTSKIGHVVIGERKNVISIDWKDSIVKKSGEELFPCEVVTRLPSGIHTWSTEKAVEYIRRLHEVRE